jgi:hypothetical protein
MLSLVRCGRGLSLVLVVALLGTSPSLADDPPKKAAEDDTSLIPAARAVAEKSDAPALCDIDDELRKKVVAKELELAATRLLIGALALSSRYEEVRHADALSQIEIAPTATGEFITKLIQWQNSYVNNNNNVSEDSSPTGRAMLATLPPGVIGFIGFAVLAETKDRSQRIFGWTLSSGALLSSIGISFGKTISGAALRQTARELSVGQRKQIRDAIEQSISGPADYVGKMLGWTSKQRAVFSSALNKKVTNTLIIATTGMEAKFTEQGSDRSHSEEIFPKLVAQLDAIDFVDLIEQEKLASVDQIAAMRALRQIIDVAEKLKLSLSASELQRLLNENDPTATMKAIVRLSGVLKQAQAELPFDSRATLELEHLIAATDQAVTTLKALCEVGR